MTTQLLLENCSITLALLAGVNLVQIAIHPEFDEEREVLLELDATGAHQLVSALHVYVTAQQREIRRRDTDVLSTMQHLIDAAKADQVFVQAMAGKTSNLN